MQTLGGIWESQVWIINTVQTIQFCYINIYACRLSLYHIQKVVADQVKYDATWIDKNAKDMVDLIFVIDRSGSVTQTSFKKAKEFVKNFLDYFSIAPLHTQVGSEKNVAFWYMDEVYSYSQKFFYESSSYLWVM